MTFQKYGPKIVGQMPITLSTQNFTHKIAAVCTMIIRRILSVLTFTAVTLIILSGTVLKPRDDVMETENEQLLRTLGEADPYECFDSWN